MKDTEYVTIEFLVETGYWDAEYGMARNARRGLRVTAGLRQATSWERSKLAKIIGPVETADAEAAPPLMNQSDSTPMPVTPASAPVFDAVMGRSSDEHDEPDDDTDDDTDEPVRRPRGRPRKSA